MNMKGYLIAFSSKSPYTRYLKLKYHSAKSVILSCNK